MVGRLESVELRDVWEKEAKDFTTWLYDNLDFLNEQLNLSAIEREKSVGPFSVDIMAEDQDGHPVIIENQLEKTDHDHLGKVLTYLSNLNAKTAIWISSDPRPEHITAINYLNEVVPQDTRFYLVQIQAFSIGESEAAPLFSIMAGPSPEAAAGGSIKKEFAGREKKRFEFFQRLIEKSNTLNSIFGNVSPTGYQNWLSAGGGKSGLAWNYVIKLSDSRVELFLCSPDAALNKKRFEILMAKSEEIENNFGESLDWDYKEGRKQHYIRSHCKIGGLQQEEMWLEIHDDLADRLHRLEMSLRNYFKDLPI